MVREEILQKAADAIMEIAMVGLEWDELVVTHDTVADFVAARGKSKYERVATNGMTVLEWQVKNRTFAIVDCGEFRAATPL